jgi:allantoate deiminase
MSERAQKVIDCCRTLATFTEDPGRITRTFLSPPMYAVHRLLGDWMRSFDMRVSVDAAGNLRGVLAGNAPRIMIGSHLDTVIDAGPFDGVLGVVIGVALAEIASTRAHRPAIEVVGFSEEEGVRYGVPFIGSRALVGALDSGTLALAEPAICDFGLDPAMIPSARFAPGAAGYLEFHIEQGQILESLQLPLGIVDAIAGQSRISLTFEGQANHAGTTPMSHRRDALAGAAEWISHVEQQAEAQEGLVATVGRVQLEPNASNVIPGRAEVSLDVRHRCDEDRRSAMSQLLLAAAEIAARRKLSVHHHQRLDQAAVPLNSGLTRRLVQAVNTAGYPIHRMTSGAGHDAMIVAPHIPSAMLLLRTPGGVSHSPQESVLVEDVEAAIAVGERFLCLTS